MTPLRTENRNEIGNIFARIHESKLELKKVNSEIHKEFSDLADQFEKKAPKWFLETLLKAPHREIPSIFDGKNATIKNLLYQTHDDKPLLINWGVWVDTTPLGIHFGFRRHHNNFNAINRVVNEFLHDFKLKAVASKDKDGYLCLQLN